MTSDACFVWVVEHVHAIRASEGRIALERARLAAWMEAATPTRFEIVFMLADWHDTREELLEIVPPGLITDGVLQEAAHQNLWQVLAHRRLLPPDFGVRYRLITNTSLDFAPLGSGPSAKARRLRLLADAGCSLPDDVRDALVARCTKSTDGMALSTVDRRVARVEAIEALAHFPELTSDDLLALYAPLHAVASYNSDRTKRGAFCDPVPALDQLFTHPNAAQALLPQIRQDAEALPLDVLRSLAALADFRSDPTFRAKMRASGEPLILFRLSIDADPHSWDAIWREVLSQSSLLALRMIEERPDAAQALDATELAPLLQESDRELRTRAVAALAALRPANPAPRAPARSR